MNHANVYDSYTPVRSDSVIGELTLSEPTDIILPSKTSFLFILIDLWKLNSFHSPVDIYAQYTILI